jgi:large subunit ribosomal protein L14
MIQVQSRIIIADNTGAKILMCIGILGKNKKIASVGDIIIGVVKSAIPNMSIKKSNIVKAVLIRTRKVIKRSDGTSLCFSENAGVLINGDKNPIGTRIFGPVAKEIRSKNFVKIISLSNEIV